MARRKSPPPSTNPLLSLGTTDVAADKVEIQSLTIRQPVIGRIDQVNRGEDASFPKPTELIEVWEGAEPLTLHERRMFNLLLANAWPTIDQVGKVHSMATEALRPPSHESNYELARALRKLKGTTLTFSAMKDGKPHKVFISLFSKAAIAERGGSVYYMFDDALIQIVTGSTSWARLQAQIMLSLSSKYSLALYELISRRINCHSCKETFTLERFRELLGVDPSKLKRWPDLRRFVVEPAALDLNALAPFMVAINPIKQGRAVTLVEVSWAPKDEEALKAAYAEVERHKIGRRARARDAIEKLIAPGLAQLAGLVEEGDTADGDPPGDDL